MKAVRRLVLVAGLAWASAGLAKDPPPIDVESRAIADKPVVQLDAAMAHVLIRSDDAMPLFLIKIATPAEEAAYETLRQTELVKAKARYVRKLAAYQRDTAAAAKLPKGNVAVPDRPIEPTNANFKITPIAMMATVTMGPMYRFAKSKERSTYLEAVTPGWYRVYGFISAVPGQPAVGMCFCMGSVKFEAKPGDIVDLGLVSSGEPFKHTAGDSSQPVDMSKSASFRRLDASTIDPRLAAYNIVPADFRPVGKIPNYLGITIGRMPPMPGVMRYDRDRIIDLTGAH